MAITNTDILFAREVADLCKKDLYGLRPHLLSYWWGLIFRKAINDAVLLRASCDGYTTSQCTNYITT